MKTALYRKYRPSTFDGVIGQDVIVSTLVHQIERGALSHAYLFTGSRGTGKTSCAKIFARAVNCKHPVNGSPCGECEVCKALASPSNLDIVEMDAASNNGVDKIRELRENIDYMPSVGKYKVYIVDEVHMLSPGAFNALLKTLEEPPAHVIFVLCTTEVHKLPATILSRCMRFDFRLVPLDKLAALVADIFAKEGVKADIMCCHGGYFKSGAGLKTAANALKTEVRIYPEAGEGGAWGMALLALYMIKGGDKTLGGYLAEDIFAGISSQTLTPSPDGMAGFDKYYLNFLKTLQGIRLISDSRTEI